MTRLDAVVEPLRADPGAAALLFDFDGTLAAVVPRPEDARPAPGVPELLERLSASYRRVAVVSGRPVSFLARWLPAAVELSGLYGLEGRVDGEVREHPEAARWRAPVAAAAADADAAAENLRGLTVEPKGLSITLHVRTHPELDPAAAALAAELGARHGLEVRSAKMSYELHPPVDVDKGTVVAGLSQGCGAVLYVGDDVGDLPAFAALDALAGAAGGAPTVRAVAVGSEELPAEVAAAADLVLADQAEVVELLRRLLPDHP